MNSIQQYTKDLIDKLNTVAAFGGRVAATIAGTEADPALVNMEAPLAWVVFQSMQSYGTPGQSQMMTLNFSAVVVLAYGKGEADFLDNQLQVIDDAAQAVRGTRSGDDGSMLWTYNGCRLLSNNTDRLLYELFFSAPAAYVK